MTDSPSDVDPTQVAASTDEAPSNAGTDKTSSSPALARGPRLGGLREHHPGAVPVEDQREERLTADLEAATESIDKGTEAIEKVAKEDEGPWFTRLGEAGITVGLVSLLLVLRLFAVADWNWEVAASLADSFNFDDAVSILLGTLFERPRVSGILISIALPLAFFRDYWLSRKGISSTRANNWFLIVALLATAYVLTRSFEMWWLFAVTAVLTLALITMGILVKTKGWNRTLSRLGSHVGVLFGVALLLLASTVDTPWVERERIETDSGTMYGYVLESDPGFLKVLTEDREVLIIPDSEVTSRTLMPN